MGAAMLVNLYMEDIDVEDIDGILVSTIIIST